MPAKGDRFADRVVDGQNPLRIASGSSMPEVSPEYGTETPNVEVRVYRHGHLVARELCEDGDRVADVLDAWAELDGVECEVDDLSTRHHPGDILEPEADEIDVEAGYPHGISGREAER
jgi:hypothetical protein